jgi:tetratricopeptide (TPR) repeat protein
MRFRSCIAPSLLVLAAAAAFGPTVAIAQVKEEESWCAGKEGATAELRIDSCTDVIRRGGISSKQLAIIYRARGAAYFARRDYARALQDYDQAIKLNSRYSEAFDNRCRARTIVNRLEDALKDCKESLRLRPDSAPALDSLGMVYIRLGRFADALTTYNAALKINPNSAYALYGRGIAKLKAGDAAAGKADLAASKAIRDVAEEMTSYGVK